MVSCDFDKNQLDKKSVGLNTKDSSLQWSQIRIHLDRQSLTIYEDNDTAHFHQWQEKDVLVKPGVIEHEPINQRDTIFIINNQH